MTYMKKYIKWQMFEMKILNDYVKYETFKLI